MFKDPISIDSTYANLQIVLNDSIDTGKKHFPNDNWPLIVGPLWVYLNLRDNGTDGLYVFESGTLRRYFPYYEERQHNKVSDTATFRHVVLPNMSKLFGTRVGSVSLYIQRMAYDSAGYVHLVSRKKVADFRSTNVY